MLVYRNNRRPRPTADFLHSLLRTATGLDPADQDAVRDLVVTFDAFESGVLDAFGPEEEATAVAESLCRSALVLADVFLAARGGRAAIAAARLRQLTAGLEALQRLPLPPMLRFAEAEGYAWYALFPEGFAAAAQRFLAQARPRAVVCIGVRQIGCSLSALAASVVAATGCPVLRCTVRPQGQPFARTFLPPPSLADRLRRQAAVAHFLLIDEGPGLSGSSLCGIADVLADWGIADERIVFLASHDPDPARLRSAAARRRWPRHRKVTGDSDPLPLLAAAAPEWEHLDLAGGRWRQLLLPPAAWPPVQPQHERCKFLFHPAGAPPAAGGRLAKFAGFGELGAATYERGVRLAAAGFVPPVLGRRSGFLLSTFLPGRPLVAADREEELLTRIAAYLATLRRDFPAAGATPGDELAAMLRHNVGEGLGAEWAERLPDLAPLFSGTVATAIDGRMLPHEWLRTSTGFFKTDALDHHADHFYPGVTDIAWDLAATEIEFSLPRAQARFLCRRYADLAGDAQVERRLPAYRLAWLAFRLGYTQLAADTLGGAEGERFRHCAAAYAARLRREIVGQAADFRLARSMTKR